MAGKRLVIAEKPSVGRALAEHLGATERHEGYLEGDDWVVTWVFGHVVEIASPTQLDPSLKTWKLEDLPILPDPHPLIPDDELLSPVRKLMERADVTEIVNACDDDREGQGIFLRILEATGCKKPCLRLWQHSLADDALEKAFASMKPNDDPYYEGLGNAALGRALADWDFGMNLTRCVTLLYRGSRDVPVLRAGRVQSPTLALVVRRAEEIESFAQKDFLQPVAVLSDGTVAWGERTEDAEEAERLRTRLEGATAHVESVSRTPKKDKAPTLMSLSDCQKATSKLLGMSAQATLDALQALYEAKLATYPRTDSSYVTQDDLDDVRALVDTLLTEGTLGAEAASLVRSAKLTPDVVANDAKVGGHGALLPTMALTADAIAKLPEGQRQVATLLVARLAMAVMPPREHVEAKAELSCEGVTLKAASDAETHAGWKAVERLLPGMLGTKPRREDGKEREGDAPRPCVGPTCAAGQDLAVTKALTHKGRTTPPKPYTQGTLIEAMEHAGRFLEDAELRAALSGSEVHASGIGTVATRAGVIQGLIDHGYIVESGKGKRSHLEPTEIGRALCGLIDETLLSPELTARLESRLAEVERGEATLAEFMAEVRNDVAACVQRQKDGFDEGKVLQPDREEVGPCPRCGKPVVKSRSGNGFVCSSNKWAKSEDGGWSLEAGCGWRLGAVNGHPLSSSRARQLLEGKTITITCKGKNGKPYKLKVRADKDDDWGVHKEFADSGPSRGGTGRMPAPGARRRHGR